jgi:demethylmenaquinone methyltransferase/2-methoxy-6-polyprenyl-1,4-benzoquinol methylase
MGGEKPVWTGELLGSPHETPDKADRIRRMFNAIAPRYGLINSLFSAGRDAAWRRKAVEFARVGKDDDVLDIACGTGDFARAFAAAGPRSVVGCDFAHGMLIRAKAPVGRTARWCEADALNLPFRSGSFSITSCAFGVRNFHDLDTGLSEMLRVLRPGGRAVILEFTRPANRLARGLYELYSTRFMPLAASLLARDRSGAYRYLPRSVVSFLDAKQMCARLRQAKFSHTTATPMMMGIVTIYIASRE